MKTASIAWALALAIGAGAAWGAGVGSPAKNYRLYCSGCHRADAAGNPGVGVPDMRNRIGDFVKVPEGRAFLVQVPGTSQSPLDDAETAALINWVLATYSARELPPGFAPYTAQEVTQLRAHPLVDVPGQRARVLQQLHEMGLNPG